MNEQLVITVVTVLFATGSLFGAKGAIDRYISNKEAHGHEIDEAEQQRETTMATAVIEQSQQVTTAMVGLAQTLVQNNASYQVQTAASLEGLRADSANRYKSLQQLEERNAEALGVVVQQVKDVDDKMGVLITAMAEGYDEPVRDAG